MKFFSKLVKSASAFVAAVAVSLSSSAVFASGVAVWNGDRIPRKDFPNIFVLKLKTAPGNPEKYVVKTNPGACVKGYIVAEGPNKWVYKRIDGEEYNVKKTGNDYSVSEYDKAFGMEISSDVLKKCGEEWKIEYMKDRSQRVVKKGASKFETLTSTNKLVRTTEGKEVPDDIVKVMLLLPGGYVG